MESFGSWWNGRFDRKFVGVFLFAVGLAALALSGSASADVNIAGNWTISSTLSFSNELINVTNTSETDGNITVTSTGSLTLNNVTLLVPHRKTLYIEGVLSAANSTFDGPAWFFWMNGTTSLTNVRVVNATQSLNSTYKEVWVESLATTFDRVTWRDANGNGSVVRLQVPLDFRGQTLEGGAGVAYDVNPTFASASIDVSGNNFNGTSSGNFYSVAIRGPAMASPLHFEIHHNVFTGTPIGVGLLRQDVNSSYTVRDMFVNTTGFGTGIMPGSQPGGDRFRGSLNITNYTILNCYVGVWMWGGAPYDTVINIEGMTAVNASYVLSIGGGVANVRNSTFTATRTWDYEGLSQGHIKIYDTTDTPFLATLPGTNATVERFEWFPLNGATWQGAVPFNGDLVSFFNETGVLNLTVDPRTWSPRYVVSWGVYPTGPRVDNRDLRPAVVDGARTFGCSPAQFFLNAGTPPINLVCTDNEGPRIVGSSPTPGLYMPSASFFVRGNTTESGAGFNGMEWSFDNSTFTPMSTIFNDSFAWNLSQGPVADGSYIYYFRATDRVGNAAYGVWGPIRIDTTFPTLALGNIPPFINSTTFDLAGTSEPFANLTVRRAYGWNQSASIPANGSFSIRVPVDEGQNTYTIVIVDRAGNTLIANTTLVVDTLAPSLTAQLDGRPETAVWTADELLDVTGACDDLTTVRVNGNVAGRAGTAFSFSLTLVPGANDIVVSCSDANGNTAAWFGFALYDATAPVLTLFVAGLTPSPTGVYTVRSNVVALDGSVVDPDSGLDTFSINGTVYAVAGDGTVTVSVPVGEGTNTLTIVATDRVGNSDTKVITIYRDTTAPALEAGLVAAGAAIVDVGGNLMTNGSTVTLHLVLSEPARVKVAGAPQDLAAGATDLTITLVEGVNSISIEFNDTAGNAGATEVLVITRDTLVPPITLRTPDANEVVGEPVATVSGKAEPGATVTVQGRDVSVSNTGDFTTTVSLIEGANAISIQAVDALGNSNSTKVSVTYTPAGVPPTTPGGTGMEIPMLLAGIAVGAAIGALAFGRRKRPSAVEPSGPEAPSPSDELDELGESLEEGPGPMARPMPNVQPPAQRGPAPKGPAPKGPVQKGPRGPQP